MLGTGTLHFVIPKFYEPLIPPVLPGSDRFWIYGSGVAELAAGALVANRRTERLGAWASFAVSVSSGSVRPSRAPSPHLSACARHC